MQENPSRPNRRSVRIKTFDYSQPSAYFITICAHANRNIFGGIVCGEMKLNALGKIVDESWLELPSHFFNIRLAAHVVMPNHMHGIVSIQDCARRATPTTGTNMSVYPSSTHRFGTAVRGSIPTIIRSFKSAVSKEAHAMSRKPRFQVWQRGYYEHIIRDQDDFENTCEYVRLNPMRWDLDQENDASQS